MKLNTASGSYVLDRFSEAKESEVTRLKHQVDLFYHKELELYKRLGLKDGMNLVECGSGPGFLISNITRDLPHCTATAVEIDPYLVELLTRNSVTDGKRLFNVQHASIYDTQLPGDTFDFVIARLVLEHLDQPAKATDEVLRLLKPGGRFVAVSNDFAYHLLTYPPIPELDELYAAYINCRISEGGNPLIGRQLPVLLRNGGFEAIHTEIIAVHSACESDRALLKAEDLNISTRLVSGGFLKKEVFESLLEKWYKMIQQPDHAIFRQLFVSSGTKGTRLAKPDNRPPQTEMTHAGGPSLGLGDLAGLAAAEQERKLGEFFAALVEAALQHQGTTVAMDTRLRDLGLDSLGAAELSFVAESTFHTQISISDILHKFSVRDIVKPILRKLNPDSASGSGSR